MGTLVDSNRVEGGCSSGASWTSAVGLRVFGDVRVQNNVLTGATCAGAGEGFQGYGVVVESAGATIDLHSNYVDGGLASDDDCITAGIRLVEGDSILLRNNIIAPGSCAAAFNIDQVGALAPDALVNNDFAPGAATAELYRIIGQTDPRTIAEVNALPGSSGNFSAACELPLVAGSACVDAGTLEGAPEQDIDGDPRNDGAPDVGPDELIQETGLCEGVTCSGLGQCFNDQGIAACLCDEGFQDDDGNLTCEAIPNYCEDVTCAHGGTCLSLRFDYACVCPPGITGPNCELTFTELTGGSGHICGLRSDGTLRCWGDDSSGQASPPPGVYQAVSAGAIHSCALRLDQTVACWGARPGPTGTFQSISAGSSHGCGIRPDGTLSCWGDNTYGEGSPPAGTFTSVTAGPNYTCAVRTDGTVACFGLDEQGRTFPPSGTFLAVATGAFASTGLRTDGTLVAWGNPNSIPPSGVFETVVGSTFDTCAIRPDRTLSCWRSFEQAVPAPSGTFDSVAVGSSNICALRTDGVVVCLGSDFFGQSTPPNGDFPPNEDLCSAVSCDNGTCVADDSLSCDCDDGFRRSEEDLLSCVPQ